MEVLDQVKVAVVGNCTAGKTTVAAGLRVLGFSAYSVAQEHSSIKKLWAWRKPHYLIFLSCSLEAAHRRRRVYWGEEMLKKQRERLLDARDNCDLYIDTSDNTPEKTISLAAEALMRRFGGMAHGTTHTGDSEEIPRS